MSDQSKGFLCVSCEFKGSAFLKAIAEKGHRVYLVTAESKQHEAWPREILTDLFFMPQTDGRIWNMDDLKQGMAHIMRSNKIDRVIALDDYDVQKAAYLREEFRMPGMGQTTARHFYDKLAMRIQARDAGIPVPGFSGLFNDEDINTFLQNSKGPWFVKPRSDAGALGIRKIETVEAFWQHSEVLGENRDRFLIEEFLPGDVYHVDSLTFNGKVLFTRCSQYLQPPFEIAHGGGIFRSHSIPVNESPTPELKATNEHVLIAFGMKHGASHSEFIISDGRVYFLETSARVGGAHLAEMVEAASGVNLWREWANIEHAMLSGTTYDMPETIDSNAGIVASLSRHEHPDYSQYHDPEIWWTMPKKYHCGFIFRHDSRQRILELLDKYLHVIQKDYHASVPLKE